jgi:hypothetical protein
VLSTTKSQIRKDGALLTTRKEDFLQDFALSVAQHYMNCGRWRMWLGQEMFVRESDCYLFKGKTQDYGFAFCPACGKQVVLLRCPPRRFNDGA